MKKILTVLIAVYGVSSNPIEAAPNMMTFDDLKELNRHRAMVKRLAAKDPAFQEKLKALALGENKENISDDSHFPGKGRKLGGKNGVNRLLGIDEEEAKRIRKEKRRLARLQKKRERAVAKRRSSSSSNDGDAKTIISAALATSFAVANITLMR